MVTCNLCKTAIHENPGLDPSQRKPCSNCGSTSRQFSLDIFESVSGYASVSTVLIPPQDASATKQSSAYPGATHPLPRFGEILLYLFLNRAERINLIGDLSEDYHEQIKKHGKRTATWVFHGQVIRSLTPRLGRVLVLLGIISGFLKALFWLFETIAHLLGH
jgi:hypothetical protein